MSHGEAVAASGEWGTVEWAVLSQGVRPQAREFFDALSLEDKAKVLALFQRLANFGRISNREKFRQLGEKAGPRGRGVWEFKSFQIRFLGDFRPGHRFIIAYGTTKKKDELKTADIEAAVKTLSSYDSKHGGQQ